jgi:cytochrome c553
MKHAIAQKPLLLATALMMGVLALSNQTFAGGADVAAGAQKSMFCSYCHGMDGNPVDGRAPRLAGQNAKSLVAKMKRDKPYQNMNHPMMQAFVTGGVLNDQDMQNLAAFYAKQPVRKSVQPSSSSPASK